MEKHYHWKLNGKVPQPVADIFEWANWFETADRIVCKTEPSDGVLVSTVFLGLDHSYSGDTPILFETMIFGGDHDSYQKRYATWEEAEEGHLKAVQIAKSPA